jgi:A/G-specific adenine glycosylase
VAKERRSLSSTRREVLLRKTGAKPVQEVWASLVERYPNAVALSRAPLEDIEEVVGVLGLKKRATALREAARTIVEETGGEVIADPEFLQSLPGIGDYATAAVLSFAWDVRAVTIDVNAARVYSRIGGFLPNTLRQGLAYARVVAETVATETNHKEVNYGVLDLAAQVCRPRPLCSSCPALGVCEYGASLVGSAGTERKG